MSGFSDSKEPVFDEISIMVPGYSLEDLPTDLDEDAAEGLLNAVAIAWHPRLIETARGIPTVRQADSVHQLTGRHLLIVPPYSEDWMSHDWREGTSHFLHEVLSGCQSRQEWLDAVETLSTRLRHELHSQDLHPQNDDGASDTIARLPEVNSIDSFDADSFDANAQVAAFLALGITWLITVLTSRRMHHFVDPDANRLSRELHLAADAVRQRDPHAVHLHLTLCYEILLEVRERFYPLPCYLIDVCLPASDTQPLALETAIRSSTALNVIATGGDLQKWLSNSETLVTLIRERTEQDHLSLLSGHAVEVRSGLGPLTASLADLDSCQTALHDQFGLRMQHWARKRFGLISSWPMLLSHLGFQSAFHVALDDGLYPDKERSQFDWQAASGATISATSRIPLAVDSAASLLRLPDRLRESMQDDAIAVLYLARLPELKTPWLNDLRIASTFGAPLGEFVTVSRLAELTASQRSLIRFDHAEYLSPALIQAAVLKTESPMTGPARLSNLWSAVESCHTLTAVLVMLTEAGSGTQLAANPPVTPAAIGPSIPPERRFLDQAVERLLQFELDHADLPGTAAAATETPAATEAAMRQLRCEQQLDRELQAHAQELALQLGNRLGRPQPGARGILLLNPLPFARLQRMAWPADWQLPQPHSAIEAVSDTVDPLPGEESAVSSRTCIVRLPPGGYVWVQESADKGAALPVFQPARRELPLAEGTLLRNRHFEVTLSERHGGIESVVFHGTRTNRVSQHIAWRFEREQRLDIPDDPSSGTHYSVTRFLSSSVVISNSVEGAIETSFELLSPVDSRRLACGRQLVRLDRFRPQLTITIELDVIDAEVKGNPWMEYLGCRFAWENEMASITRSVWGQVAGFRGERFESPDYIEVADEDRRLTIIPHGRPYHRRSGRRMLDSLLICEGEVSRRFDLTLLFDQPFPMRQALDVCHRPVHCEMVNAAPSAAHAWLWGLSARNVMVVRLRGPADNSPGTANSPSTADSPSGPEGPRVCAGRCVRLLLLETEGMIADCVIRTAIRPIRASLILHNGQTLEDIPVLDDGVMIRFNRFELREVELQF